MFQVTKKSEYGLRAMIVLAKNYNPPTGGKKICSVKSISEKEGISFDFLEKIISCLEKSKLVKGSKGSAGGYVLAKSPNKISVKSIINSLEGSRAITNCPFCPRNKKCIAKNAWQKIDKSLSKTLQQITLAQLIK
jgi:Rrf2 family protein